VLGHSYYAHAAFGWCAVCSDHDVTEELWAWRLLAQRGREPVMYMGIVEGNPVAVLPVSVVGHFLDTSAAKRTSPEPYAPVIIYGNEWWPVFRFPPSPPPPSVAVEMCPAVEPRTGQRCNQQTGHEGRHIGVGVEWLADADS
jgi:hypothetical protein